jgi:tetratricopeptide (TPR) repeat protein
MRVLCHLGAAIAAAGAVFLAGCATGPRAGSHAGPPDSPPSSPVPEQTGTSGDVDRKIVDAHAHYIQGMIADMDDQPDDALADLSQAALDDPANEDLVLDLSSRYVQLHEPDKALDILTRATHVPGASGAIYARLGRVCSDLGRDAEAVQASETAVRRAPALLTGYENLFLINLQKGHVVSALAVLQDASKQTDAPTDFLLDLAGLYLALEREAPSQEAAARAGERAALAIAAIRPVDSPHTELRLADAYNLSGDITNAIPIYEQLVDQFAAAPGLQEDIRNKLTDLYIRTHDFDKARSQLEATIEADPANAQAYFILGNLACDARKMADAEGYFKQALILAEEPDWYYELAEVQIDLDHTKDALGTLARARTKYEASFQGEFLTGLAYSRSHDYTNAVFHFTSAELLARASDPKRLDEYFYFEEGAAYERKSDYDDAEDCFEKALKLAPESAEVLNYLGYMLADRGVKLQHARELIVKAVDLDPKNSAYLDSLGWVFYKLNQPRDALQPELDAIKFSPEPDAILYDHLGDIYAALKQTDKAREAWQKSLTVEPNDQIRRKLETSAPH